LTAADRDKWNQRFADGAYADRINPTALLARHAPQIPVGRALDVACGAGRNALYLASLGFEVDALDISAVALDRARAEAAARALRVNFVEADLDAGWPDALDPAATWDLIVLVRYVNMPLLRFLSQRVAPGGCLLCEEHLRTTRDVAGPRSPAFRLANGELAAATASLDLRFYREGILTDPDGRSVAVAQAIATCGGACELNYC
jgi:SAM-dependent methyltransferase